MNHLFKTATAYLLGRDRANRYFSVYPDDTFVVSYPRSGSTWSRFLIANLVFPDNEVSFANIDRFVPATASLSRRALARVPRPRIIKCHNYFDHRYNNVIYIVRDPRDVVLSEYRFVLKRRVIPDFYPIEQFVARFIKGEVNNYCSWRESVGTWMAARNGSERFLLLRYEDMVSDTVAELGKVASFLKIKATPDRLERAVERSSSDRMRAMEQSQSEAWVVTRGGREDVPFVGAAKSGQWKTALPPSCVKLIEDAWGPIMQELGYRSTAPGADIAPTSAAIIRGSR
jgi:hypothetical protein